MLTTRDYEVIDFVKQFKVADTDVISSLFFPNLRMCQYRLKSISDSNKLKRIRDNVTSKYIYFHKMPNQLNHSLLVTKFYSELCKFASVSKFRVEPVYNDIRPDGAFVFNYNGIPTVGLLEIELSNKGFDWNKYVRFCSHDNYKPFMTVQPTLFIVSDKVKPIDTCFKYHIIDTDFTNLRHSFGIR